MRKTFSLGRSVARTVELLSGQRSGLSAFRALLHEGRPPARATEHCRPRPSSPRDDCLGAVRCLQWWAPRILRSGLRPDPGRAGAGRRDALLPLGVLTGLSVGSVLTQREVPRVDRRCGRPAVRPSAALRGERPSVLLGAHASYPAAKPPTQIAQLRLSPHPAEKRARSGVDLRRWLPWRSRPFAEGVGARGPRASTCASLLGPLPEKASSRFMFCPAAVTIASAFTRQSLLSLKGLVPCHSLASENMGSTHTLRLRNACS